MVTATRAETGVLAYQRFISHDQRTIYVHERYENSDAAAGHIFGTSLHRLARATRVWLSGGAFSSSAIRATSYGRCWIIRSDVSPAIWSLSLLELILMRTADKRLTSAGPADNAVGYR